MALSYKNSGADANRVNSFIKKKKLKNAVIKINKKNFNNPPLFQKITQEKVNIKEKDMHAAVNTVIGLKQFADKNNTGIAVNFINALYNHD